MQPLVILSPHFDDSVLSCGGRIGMAVQQAQPVRVLTLFAGSPVGEPPPFAQVQHRMWGDPSDPNRLRRAEDVVAHARLGCLDLHHLSAGDAVYRLDADGTPLYGAEEAIFGPVHPAEEGLAAQIADEVGLLLPTGATVLAPLGIGGHVDHQLGHTVGCRLRQGGWEVGFYEELPYTGWEGALALALADKAGWQENRYYLSAEALAAKVEAMAYYRTQIPVLYGNEETMRLGLTAAARTVAGAEGYAERVWWPG